MAYPVLKTGNFYFPIDDMNTEFEVVDAYDFEITDKKVIKEFMTMRRIERFGKSFKQIYSKFYADLFWDKCKIELKEYFNKGYYIVPSKITYHKFKGKEYLTVSVDLLKKIKWYHKILSKLKGGRNE